MKAMNKSVKMTYKGEIKRSSLPKTFEELKVILIKAYDLKSNDLHVLNVSYMDDEGDTVLISDEFDFNQARIFMEKEKVDCLKVTLEKSSANDQNEPSVILKQDEVNETNNCNYEMINGPTKFEFVKKDLSLKKSEGELLNSLNANDLVVQSLNEMRLSTELAKSEILSKEFVNDSNEEDCCKDIVHSMEKNEKVKIKNKVEFENIENSSKLNPPTKENISDKFNKLKENIQKKAERISKATQKITLKLINKFTQRKNATNVNSNNANFDVTVKEIKKQARHKLNKMIEKRLHKLKLKLLKSTYQMSDSEIDRIVSNAKLIKTQNNSVHERISCDGCKMNPIIGSRYKCSVCEDFDYCEECEDKNKDVHIHPFVKIRTPSNVEVKIITQDNKCPYIKDECNFKKITEGVIQNYVSKVINLNKNLKENIKEFKNACNEGIEINTNKILKYFDTKQNKEVLKSELSSICVSKNLTVQVNNSSEIRKSIKLLNNGKLAWPRPCYFTCLQNESTICGKTNLLKVKVDAGKEINVEVLLSNKEGGVKEGEYVSVWQLQNEKREGFGDKVEIKVKIEFSNQIAIKSEFIEMPKEIFTRPVREIKIKTCADLVKIKSESKFMNIVNKMKKEYELKGVEDKKILYAIVMANGNVESALDHLFNRSTICNYHPKNFN